MPRPRPRIVLVFSLLALVSALPARRAEAHGMGASYFAQRLEVRLGPEWVHVAYTLEVPVSILQREFVEIARKDREAPLDELKQDFRARKTAEIRAGLEVRLNDHVLALEDDPDGTSETRVNDRVFMLYRFALRAPIDRWLEDENALEIHCSAYEGRDTLYSLEVDAGDGIAEVVTGLEEDERFFVDPRSEIAWYPSSRHRHPTIRFRRGAGAASSSGAASAGGDEPHRGCAAAGAGWVVGAALLMGARPSRVSADDGARARATGPAPAS